MLSPAENETKIKKKKNYVLLWNKGPNKKNAITTSCSIRSKQLSTAPPIEAARDADIVPDQKHPQKKPKISIS